MSSAIQSSLQSSYSRFALHSLKVISGSLTLIHMLLWLVWTLRLYTPLIAFHRIGSGYVIYAFPGLQLGFPWLRLLSAPKSTCLIKLSLIELSWVDQVVDRVFRDVDGVGQVDDLVGRVIRIGLSVQAGDFLAMVISGCLICSLNQKIMRFTFYNYFDLPLIAGADGSTFEAVEKDW